MCKSAWAVKEGWRGEGEDGCSNLWCPSTPHVATACFLVCGCAGSGWSRGLLQLAPTLSLIRVHPSAVEMAEPTYDGLNTATDVRGLPNDDARGQCFGGLR